jgi:hypothetical protein
MEKGKDFKRLHNKQSALLQKWENVIPRNGNRSIALRQERHGYKNRFIPTDQSGALQIKM